MKQAEPTRIVFLSGFFPTEKYTEIIENSNGGIQYAADALQKSLMKGLSDYSKIDVINFPFIGSWPSRYKSWLSPQSYNTKITLEGEDINLLNHKFINISGIKILSRYIRAKKALTRYCKANITVKVVLLIYSIHTPFLKAAIDVKKRYGNLKIIQIVPDLPEYMSEDKGFKSYLRLYNQKLLSKLYSDIDGFVLLTEYMKDRLIGQNQPYVVVEGIFNPNDVAKADMQSDVKGKKVIMYSGTLARRYNVMDLVDAAQSLKRDDFVLEIYGDGDARDEIEAIEKLDSRIKHGGQLYRDQILQKQKEAFLLVNPRASEGEYTKYSFPSKTMEYLASGTPTLMNKLPGIPEEYQPYFFSPEKECVESLAIKINEILDTPNSYLAKFGANARNFILENKNPKVQCKKIIELIDKL